MPEIPSRLQKLVNDGFRVVFFSNQVSMSWCCHSCSLLLLQDHMCK